MPEHFLFLVAVAAAAATLCIAAVPLWGQESPLPDLFSDVTDVRIGNVEVVITDRKGNRVLRHLQQDLARLGPGDQTR